MPTEKIESLEEKVIEGAEFLPERQNPTPRFLTTLEQTIMQLQSKMPMHKRTRWLVDRSRKIKKKVNLSKGEALNIYSIKKWFKLGWKGDNFTIRRVSVESILENYKVLAFDVEGNSTTRNVVFTFYAD